MSRINPYYLDKIDEYNKETLKEINNKIVSNLCLQLSLNFYVYFITGDMFLGLYDGSRINNVIIYALYNGVPSSSATHYDLLDSVAKYSGFRFNSKIVNSSYKKSTKKLNIQLYNSAFDAHGSIESKFRGYMQVGVFFRDRIPHLVSNVNSFINIMNNSLNKDMDIIHFYRFLSIIASSDNELEFKKWMKNYK
jgi:hypothetical protein